jgi:hypothetical protein
MKIRLQHFAAGPALTLFVALTAGCGHESVASPGARPASASLPAAAATESPADPVEPVEPIAGESVPSEIAADAAEPPAVALKSESPENDAEPPPVKGQRPPADRTPAKPGEAEKITWDDLNIGMPADVVFRPFMLSDRAKELEGKKISILGFIHGAATGGSKAKIKELILLKNTECKYGPQGQADHLAAVYFAEGKATSYTDKAIKVEGTLKIEPFAGDDGNTWSVFRLEDAVVK